MASNNSLPRLGTPEWTQMFIKSMQQGSAAQQDTGYTPSPYSPEDFNTGAATPPSQGWGSKAIGALFRPFYGITGFAHDLVAPMSFSEGQKWSREHGGEQYNSLLNGFVGQTHDTWGDVLKVAPGTKNFPDWVNNTLGFAGDMVIDPANFVIGPVGKLAITGGKALTGTARAARAVQKAGDAAHSARVSANAASASRRLEIARQETLNRSRTSAANDSAMARVTQIDRSLNEAGSSSFASSPMRSSGLSESILDTSRPVVDTSGLRSKASISDVMSKIREGQVTKLSSHVMAKIREGRVTKPELSSRSKSLIANADATIKELDDFLSYTGRNVGDSIQPITIGSKAATSVLKANSAKIGRTLDDEVQAARSTSIAKGIFEEADLKGYHGPTKKNPDAPLRSDATGPAFMKTLREVESAEKLGGDLHQIRSPKGTKYSVSMGDVLEEFPDSLIKRTILDHGTAIPHSAITAMAARAMDYAGKVVPLKEVKSKVIEAGMPYVGKGLSKEGVAQGSRTATKIENSIRDAANFLSKEDVRATLLEKTAGNRAISESTKIKAGVAAGNAVAAKTTKDIANGDVSAAIESVTSVDSNVGKLLGDSPEALTAGKKEAHKAIGDIVTPEDYAAARRAKATVNDYKAMDEGKLSPAKAKAKAQAREIDEAKSAAKEIEEMADDGLIKPDENTFTTMEIEQQALRKGSVLESLRSVGATWGIAAGKLAEMYRNNFSGFLTLAEQYDKGVRALFRPYSKEQQLTAFKQVRSGIPPVGNAEQMDLYEMMKGELNHLVDTADEPMMGGMFRTSASVEDINKTLKEERVMWEAPEDVSRADAAASWKLADIDDPVEFLSRLNSAQAKLATRMSIGSNLAERFGSPRGGMIDDVKFAKVPKDLGFDSDIMKHIPRVDKEGKSIYYPEIIVKQLTELERILKKPTKMESKFFNKYADPIMTAWKAGVTIARPGHHPRNMAGDITLNAMYGVLSPEYYRYASQAMKAGGLLAMKDANKMTTDMARMLTTKPVESIASNPKAYKLQIKLKGGKVHNFDDVNSVKMQIQSGILPSYTKSEDLLVQKIAREGTSGAQRFTDRLLKTKYMRTMAHVGEFTSHHPRMAQFEYIMRNKKVTSKFDSMDELLEYAGKEIRRTHPDSMGLSPEGMKYMRRIFPFYSWMRQVIPFTLETAMTHPTSITGYTKSVNYANEMLGGGAESPTDPYPANRFIPDFIRNNLGFIGGDHTFNLGTPTEAVFGDMLNGNPVSNVMGMLNPAISAPIELGTGHSLSTGAYIPDKGQYIDSQIPGISNLSSISGYSASGTVANILTGNGGLDPQRAVAKGEKDRLFNTSLFNFITGLTVQGFNKPSYEHIAKEQAKGRVTNPENRDNATAPIQQYKRSGQQ